MPNPKYVTEVVKLNDSKKNVNRKPRLYFGGLSGSLTSMIIQPLDVLKVTMQTQQKHTSIVEMVRMILKENGLRGFYNGISAAVLRQMTFTLTRFSVYEQAKRMTPLDTFWKKIIVAWLGGFVGGFVGTPADIINVRMQSDAKMPPHKRRNYKHVFHGLYSVVQHEGHLGLFNGWAPVAIRGGCLNIAQLACYEQIKDAYMKYLRDKDDFITHTSVSVCSAIIGVTLTHPLDVIKARTMNARPGEFKNLWGVIKHTASLGPSTFARGYVPALMRMVPSTTITLVIFESLRIRFGIDPPPTEETLKKVEQEWEVSASKSPVGVLIPVALGDSDVIRTNGPSTEVIRTNGPSTF